MLEASTGAAIAVDDAPGPPSGSATALPVCPFCGDAQLEPVAVCDEPDRARVPDEVLALRCALCASLVFDPLPRQAPDSPTAATPNWLTPTVEGQLGRWCRRALGPEARILYVGSDVDLAALRARLLPSQSLRRVEPDRLGELLADSVDAALVVGVLELTQDPGSIIRRLERSLDRRGRIMVIGPNLDASAFRLFGGRHWAGYGAAGQRHLLSLAALRGMGRQAGLDIDLTFSLAFAEGWIESLRRFLVDWRAPHWLTRLMTRTPVGTRPLGLLEASSARSGRGWLLCAALRRSERSSP